MLGGASCNSGSSAGRCTQRPRMFFRAFLDCRGAREEHINALPSPLPPPLPLPLPAPPSSSPYPSLLPSLPHLCLQVLRAPSSQVQLQQSGEDVGLSHCLGVLWSVPPNLTQCPGCSCLCKWRGDSASRDIVHGNTPAAFSTELDWTHTTHTQVIAAIQHSWSVIFQIIFTAMTGTHQRYNELHRGSLRESLYTPHWVY